MPNTLTDVMPKILSSALDTLREKAVMPRLVNSDYSEEAASKGAVINVPVPTALTAQDVVPGPYSQTTADLTLNTVQIPLNFWKEAPFYLTDKDLMEIMDGVPNMQIKEAAKALANAVDLSLLNLYTGIYNFTGTPGTTPFAVSSSPQGIEAINARKILSKWLAPEDDRRIVLNLDAEANALGLPAFQYYLNAGTDATIREGQIGRKLGFDWYSDQISVTAPKPSLSTLTINLPTAVTAGSSTATFSAGTLTGSVAPGDIFSVAGDSQTYVVTAPANAASNAITVQFAPKSLVNWNANSAVTFRDSHAVNLAFHRDAFALAVRPLQDNAMMSELGGSLYQTMTDPVTGIPLRLEVRREYKRVRWSLDLLWGVGLVRPQFACRIAG